MALDAETAKELIKKLSADRDAYLDSVNKTHELLLRTIAASSNGESLSIRGPRLTSENIDHQNTASAEVDSIVRDRVSTTGLGDDSDDDENSSIFVQTPLAKAEYSMEGFRKHLHEYRWSEEDRQIVGEALDDPEIMSRDCPFPTRTGDVPDRSHLTHYSIFDVGPDGSPLSIKSAEDQDASQALKIWNRLKSVNANPARERQAVGRITVVREPSPLLFAAIHYTHIDHFDVDELFSLMVDDNPGLAHPHRAFDEDKRHQRSFVMTMEYYTLQHKDCKAMSWQQSDPGARRSGTEIPISRCSSVVALSLEGDYIGKVKNRDRHFQKKFGNVYDPFSPWRVLNIQAYPDIRSTLDAHDATKHYVNGPEAFLVTLRAELKDASKRLSAVYKEIALLIEPSGDFIFDKNMRDKLLFEDSQFTYSRRYFWATTTLGVMNQDIVEMETTIRETFKDSVWNGTNKIIWPGEETQSSRFAAWRKRMTAIRKDIDKELAKLARIKSMNESKMKEIKSLRDILFSGTSVRESRMSVEHTRITVEQGRNIKLLTLVTIFFLPLTFTTSVFSMTAIPETAEFHHFAIATVAICLPCYLFIGSLNTAAGIEWWDRRTKTMFHELGKGTAWFLALLHYRPKWTEIYSREEEPEDITPIRKPRPRRADSTEHGLEARRRAMTFGGLPLSREITREDTLHSALDSAPGAPERSMTIPSPGLQSRQPIVRFDRRTRSGTFKGSYDLPRMDSPTSIGMHSPIRGSTLESEKEAFQIEAKERERNNSGTILARLFRKRKGSLADDSAGGGGGPMGGRGPEP